MEDTRQEDEALRKEEEQFWVDYNAKEAELQQLESDENQIDAQLLSDREILAHLEKSDAYTDVFCIEQDGRGMASINGLRLGRLSSSQASAAGEQIDWNEINAAWGQTAFLLTVLSRKLTCQFTTYKVHPRGSFSTVERFGADKGVYELYGTSDWQIGRLLHSRRFDHAMVGVLSCVEQLCHKAQELDPSFTPPYAYVYFLTQNSKRHHRGN